jgi:methionyl aminopeptidase
LIEASEKALKMAIELVKKKGKETKLGEIGLVIQEAINSLGYTPIVNLSGHGLGEYDLHSGFNIPNFDSGSEKELGEGAFAIEPFATSGEGRIYEASGGNIYHVSGNGKPRDNFSREVLSFILENKKMLPFSQRELEKKFGKRVLSSISMLKMAGIIKEFPQLVEESHKPVSQAESTLMIYDGRVEVVD